MRKDGARMAQNKAVENYIEAYKELEKTVKPKYGSVLDYEKTLSQDEMSKMQICRILRNHIQHSNDTSFVAITPAMQAFIEKKTYDVQSQDGVLKDFMVSSAKYGFITGDMTVVDAAALLKKKSRTEGLVIDKKGEILGYLTKGIISDFVSEGSVTKATKVSKIIDRLDTDYTVQFCGVTTPMYKVNQMLDKNPDMGIVAVNTAGKIVGVYEV